MIGMLFKQAYWLQIYTCVFSNSRQTNATFTPQTKITDFEELSNINFFFKML